MTTPTDDDKLAQHARAVFDDSVEKLDAATLSRLNQGRQQALAEIAAGRSGGARMRWVPATGVAAAAAVAVVVWQGAPNESATAPIQLTDFEIMLSEDSLEMIEDFEFYSWVDVAGIESNGDVS